MKKNVGGMDKGFRIVLGLVIIGAGAAMGSWWGAVGLVPLLTGLMGWCAAYAIFGVSSCQVKDSE